VYPAGIQGAGPARARGEAILLQQINATRAHRLFIPGNHDWGYEQFRQGSPKILENEQRLVDEHLRAGFVPRDGCPGPNAVPLMKPTRDLPGGVTLIALDLYWWFLPEERRPVCAGIKTTDDFIAQLRTEARMSSSSRTIRSARAGRTAATRAGSGPIWECRSSTASTPCRT